MRTANPRIGLFVGCMVLLGASSVRAQDWPQWLGPKRDASVTGFTAPKSWPKELTQKWKVTVGEGVATPALVGDKLYVFCREGGDEVLRCLDAANGKELWKDRYAAAKPGRPASGFNNEFVGPRSSPTVADGKVVTLGVQGTLSCFDAVGGKLLWRKETGRGPKFFTSSSPIVVDGLAIVQIGSDTKGAVATYNLADGTEKWKWDGSTAYASPVLLSVDGTKAVIAETEQSVVALNLADGKRLWEAPFAVARMSYNASTPIVSDTTLIYGGSGRGTRAVKFEKKDGGLAGKELWSNTDNSVKFNTPIVKDGSVYAISDRDKLFCIDKDGKTAWDTSLGGGGGGRGQGGYGSIVDAGPVLLALTPKAQLVVFKPSDKKFEEIAHYKVADGQTYAYPIVAGNRIFVKDKDSLYLWTIE